MLTSVYDAFNNKNKIIKNNDKRVIGIAQLCLSAVLEIGPSDWVDLTKYYTMCVIIPAVISKTSFEDGVLH